MRTGEVTPSVQKSHKKKNAKDLVRVKLSLKDALDLIQDDYGIHDTALIGWQVNGQIMAICFMFKCGNLYRNLQKTFLPSQNRKKDLDGNSLGRRPDFMLRTSLRGIICYLFFMEAKKVRQGAAVVQDDQEKMAGMMKDAIDDMSKHGINIENVEVIGLHIVVTTNLIF
ncbi:hypothetical protein BGZ49_005812 [Haplosporangium sp. Z 27]|nr:hypothetical protein BGZ49_005812 [Haplosporangium sp. Z 27]